MIRFYLPIALIATLLTSCTNPSAQAPATPEASPVAGSADMPAVADADPAVPAEMQAPPAPAGTMQEGTAAAADAVDTVDNADVNKAIDDNLGDHGKYEAVINSFQKAVTDVDRAGVAELVDYPISVSIGGKDNIIKNAAGFVADYDRFMTPEIVAVIKSQRYADLFVNYKGVMFGNGEAWVNGICKDDACKDFDAKVVTIQSAP